MAVRTGPAGGGALPGWVRTREGADPGTVHLTVVDPRAVTAEDARRCCAALAAAGYRTVETNALNPGDAEKLLEAGFAVRESLLLFGHDLRCLPRPQTPTRRARHLGDLVPLDGAAFGPRAFDVDALRDACEATPRARVRVCGPRSRPLAYAITGLAGRRAYVQRLAVHPDARGQGLARALLGDGLRWARRRGARTAVVNTHTENLAARRLYETSGFVAVPQGLVVLGRAL